MVTDEEKTKNLVEVEGITIYGLALGMWELFGDSSFATTNVIGDLILSRMEQASGLEIQGESPQHILTELVRLFSDETGFMESGKAEIEGDHITFSSTKCFGETGCNELQKAGVQPFYCPIYNVVTAAMRARQAKRSRFISRKWDVNTQTCTLEIQVIQ